MKIRSASFEIVYFDPETDTKRIAKAASLCYHRELPETYEDQQKYIASIIKMGHTSILEHSSMSVIFTCNRGVSHELVRHRHCGFSQESTRYCNYSCEKFDKSLTFISDSHVNNDSRLLDIWIEGRQNDEREYIERILTGEKPEQVRGCLPNDLATKLMVTASYREWRSIFELRCPKRAHYQMRELMVPLYKHVCDEAPHIFGDLDI